MAALAEMTPMEGTAWARALAMESFTFAELGSAVGVNPQTIGVYVRQWVADGRAERIEEGRVAHARYRIAAGARPAPVRDGSKHSNMWLAMRMLVRFSAVDLAAHCSTGRVTVTREDAQAYCGVLLRHGYLKCLRKAAPDRGIEAVYQLIRNTGPKPPVLKRIRALFDPNQDAYRMKGCKL